MNGFMCMCSGWPTGPGLQEILRKDLNFDLNKIILGKDCLVLQIHEFWSCATKRDIIDWNLYPGHKISLTDRDFSVYCPEQLVYFLSIFLFQNVEVIKSGGGNNQHF